MMDWLSVFYAAAPAAPLPHLRNILHLAASRRGSQPSNPASALVANLNFRRKNNTMADPLSIAASCVGLLSAIATATVRINGFVRTARDARPDLNAVSRELSSLRTVLELIQADAEESQNQLPESIINHLCEVLTNCNGAVADIEKILKKYEKNDAMTSGRWAMSGKGDVEKLRTHLEAHTSALSLVLNMMNLCVVLSPSRCQPSHSLIIAIPLTESYQSKSGTTLSPFTTRQPISSSTQRTYSSRSRSCRHDYPAKAHRKETITCCSATWKR